MKIEKGCLKPKEKERERERERWQFCEISFAPRLFSVGVGRIYTRAKGFLVALRPRNPLFECLTPSSHWYETKWLRARSLAWLDVLAITPREAGRAELLLRVWLKVEKNILFLPPCPSGSIALRHPLKPNDNYGACACLAIFLVSNVSPVFYCSVGVFNCNHMETIGLFLQI